MIILTGFHKLKSRANRWIMQYESGFPQALRILLIYHKDCLPLGFSGKTRFEEIALF